MSVCDSIHHDRENAQRLKNAFSSTLSVVSCYMFYVIHEWGPLMSKEKKKICGLAVKNLHIIELQLKQSHACTCFTTTLE